MTDQHHDEFFSADDLRALGSDYLRLKRDEQAAQAEALAAAKRKVIDEMHAPFTITDEVRRRFMGRLKAAAARGETSMMVLRFPTDLCTDQGRAINARHVDWPDSLVGRPRQFFEIWRDELKAMGYGLHAEILDYPDGMPGDAGIFLTWGN